MVGPPTRSTLFPYTTLFRSPRRPNARPRAFPARASRCARAATPARWRRAAPTPPACGIPALRACPAPGSSVEEALRDGRVSVDAPVAEKGPVAPHVLLVRAVALDDEHCLVRPRGLGQHDAEGVADERRAPELESAVRCSLVSDPVHCGHLHAVGDGVRALHHLPRGHLPFAMRRLLAGLPADRGGIE